MTDFQHGVDQMGLGSMAFAALPDELTSTNFANHSPTTDKQFIWYDHSTGVLTYDSNGSKAGGTIARFAVLDNHPASLSLDDFYIFGG